MAESIAHTRGWVEMLVEEASLKQERVLEAHHADLQNVWRARNEDLKMTTHQNKQTNKQTKSTVIEHRIIDALPNETEKK